MTQILRTLCPFLSCVLRISFSHPDTGRFYAFQFVVDLVGQLDMWAVMMPSQSASCNVNSISPLPSPLTHFPPPAHD